jgi:hypothetical protein
MKRSSAIGAALAAALLIGAAANAGSQTSAPTLSFLDATSRGTQHFLDNAPSRRAGTPRSKRFRLSIGDELYTLSPILDAKTSNRIGTSYSQFTVVSGNSFGNAWFKGHGVFQLYDGQIVVDGITKAATTTNTVAVVGGTGAYKGARGSMTFTETTNGSQDIMHLLP